VLGTLRKINLDRLLGLVGRGPNRCRDLVVAMIVARLIAPLSKLATAKALDPITAASSLGEVLWGRWTRTNSTRRLTGCSNASRRSKSHWHVATSRTAPSFKELTGKQAKNINFPVLVFGRVFLCDSQCPVGHNSKSRKIAFSLTRLANSGRHTSGE
jgi:hypothetical protein